VAEAVVELASLGVREHLVRLDDLPETVFGVGRVGDVRMELTREPPERPLDVVGARIATDAQELVVIPLGAQLSS